MPTINLPIVDFDIDSSTNEETLNSILDTLQLYRKELNFLLMNLDEDNMPAIQRRIEDGEGNISVIQQDINKIQLAVADNAGNIGNLQIMADNISMAVANNAGDIAQLQIRAGSIESAVADNAGNISVLYQTADGIQTQVTNQAGEISTLTQTANGIQTQVTDNKSKISTLTQTVDGIQTQVTSIDDELGVHSSQITQLDWVIQSKVSYTDYNGREIVSLIEQTPSSIKISAEHIDLIGITRIYSSYDSSIYAEMGGRMGDFSLMYRGDEFFNVYNTIDGVDLRCFGDTFIRFSGYGITTFEQVCKFYDDVDFRYGAYFSGVADFSNATVRGIDMDVPRDVIRAYYSSNAFFIDYGGGNRLTVRDRGGKLVGYVNLD